MQFQNIVQRQPLNRVGMDQVAMEALGDGTIGARLAKRRLALGLTRGQVAAPVMIEPKSGPQAGVQRPISRNAYAMYELDVLEPSLNTLKALAAALRVSLYWLAFGFGKPTRKKTEIKQETSGVPHLTAPVSNINSD